MEILQGTFYFLAIIFMLAGIAFFGVLTYATWQFYQHTKNLPQDFEGKISELFSSKKMEMASMAGMFISSVVFSKMKNWFKKK